MSKSLLAINRYTSHWPDLDYDSVYGLCFSFMVIISRLNLIQASGFLCVQRALEYILHIVISYRLVNDLTDVITNLWRFKY